MWFELTFLLATAALLIEAAIGYPPLVFRIIAHPVVWIGAMIDRLERALNRATLPDRVRRLNGAILVLVLLIATIGPAALAHFAIVDLVSGVAAALLLALPGAMLLAQRSLAEHVAAVARSLEDGSLPKARIAAGHIIGRDTEGLDRSDVAGAAIESLAENFSDAVVAPTFWGALFGLPGMIAFKSINTADSMIGHRSDRYKDFGWAAARLDDLVNLPAARLAALWLIIAAVIIPGARPLNALRTAVRDAGKHISPNAGWPEAAMAGALGIRLGGPRQYHDRKVDGAWMGDAPRTLDAGDIRLALNIYRAACLVQILVLGLLSALILLR